jgi:hypothetical protein
MKKTNQKKHSMFVGMDVDQPYTYVAIGGKEKPQRHKGHKDF